MPTINKLVPKATMTATPATSALPQTSVRTRSAWDLPQSLKLMIYGRSGTGKTTFWSTFPRPILALICSGSTEPGELLSIDTPENRRTIDARIVTKMAEVKGLLADANKFATVVLDHVSGLQDLCMAEILGMEELPAQKTWGLATQQQWGQSTAQCKDVLRDLLGHKVVGNVVIVGQEREDRPEGDHEIVAPTVGVAATPSLAGWLNPAVNYIFQTYTRPRFKVDKKQVAGKEVDVRIREPGVDFCLRIAPHDLYTTKCRLPKGFAVGLPECVTDPNFNKLLEVIRRASA